MSGLAIPSLSLTPRDINILLMTYWYNGLVIELLRRRFWSHSTSHNAYYRRIAQLIGAGYLESHQLEWISGHGSAQRFLTLGPQGRLVVAEVLGVSRAELNRATRTVAPWLINHHVAVCNFRLSLELAVEHSSWVSLAEWVSEEQLKQVPIIAQDPRSVDGSIKVHTIKNIPDGQLTLALGNGTRQSYYLELDNGTISAGEMRERCRGYLIDSRTRHPLLPILFVVPTTKRVEAIARWAQEAARALAADPTIFWLTTQAAVSEQTILGTRIWKVVGVPQGQSLVPAQSRVGPNQPDLGPNPVGDEKGLAI